MRHLKKKKVGKGKDHRRKLLRSLASSLVLYEKIKTTYANGRAAKSYTEKLITTGKSNTLHARRQLLRKLSPMAVKKVMEVYGPKYLERKGGYIRLTKLNDPKAGDSKVVLEFVE